jgi:hypothetical protein
MQDRRFVEESLLYAGLAPELAASAREHIVRLEENNARLQRENRLLREHLITLRPQEDQDATGRGSSAGP